MPKLTPAARICRRVIRLRAKRKDIVRQDKGIWQGSFVMVLGRFLYLVTQHKSTVYGFKMKLLRDEFCIVLSLV